MLSLGTFLFEKGGQMEEGNMIENSGLQIPGNLQDYIRSTAKWTRFVSVLFFVFAGLMLLIAAIVLIGFFFLGSFGGRKILIQLFIMLVEAIVFTVPMVYLFKFSSTLKRILAGDTGVQTIEDAVRYQKSYWKFMGIVALIGIAVMILVFLIAILAGVIMKARGLI